MKFLFSICMLLLVTSITAQKIDTISPTEAASRIGDSVRVCGKVYGGIYLEKTSGKLTLLNVGGAYPNSPFTVVLPMALRVQMGIQPEVQYKDKSMCFTGRIELYKAKPQILLNQASQITEDKALVKP